MRGEGMECPAFVVVGGKEYRCQRLHNGLRATHSAHAWHRDLPNGGRVSVTWTAEVTRHEVDAANAGRRE